VSDITFHDHCRKFSFSSIKPEAKERDDIFKLILDPGSDSDVSVINMTVVCR
jgi:hypothetical protein